MTAEHLPPSHVDGAEFADDSADPDEAGRADAAGEPMTLYLVKRLEMLVRSLMDDALRSHGVTTLQYTALSVLARQDGMSSAALARRSFVTPQSMNEMVLWFERRGLVARERDPKNRRVLLIHLTDDGRQVVADCTEIVRDLDERALESMDADERHTFRAGLRRGYASLLPLSGHASTPTGL